LTALRTTSLFTFVAYVSFVNFDTPPLVLAISDDAEKNFFFLIRLVRVLAVWVFLVMFFSFGPKRGRRPSFLHNRVFSPVSIFVPRSVKRFLEL